MSSNCAVYGCFNNSRNRSDVRFFRFPRDDEFRKKWINACRRDDKVNTNNALVCSAHFTAEDYIDDMKSRLLGIESPRNKRLLKAHVVPSLNLYTQDCGLTKNSEDRFKRAEKRGMKRTVEDLLEDESVASVDRPSRPTVETGESPAAIEENILVTHLETVGGMPVSNSIENDNFALSHDLCKREISKLKEKIQILGAEIKSLQAQV
ncbi:THAP domain-containing protein 1-like [Macrobrachium rosenbergii]|uniref:THAP domain-containing protein 1-like n=1 Tax=Macrobrachium rosenbergii TaxID=79674 RepID=UPI0034D3BA23